MSELRVVTGNKGGRGAGEVIGEINHPIIKEQNDDKEAKSLSIIFCFSVLRGKNYV